ncbi:MAG: hypothetical protein HC881_22565 [Leptolyngbyaceae cyanobacterium SL_7_1]|nr:hypothetical protein [Leptolyngbyaceae cyanobacterium SL_7_1]
MLRKSYVTQKQLSHGMNPIAVSNGSNLQLRPRPGRSCLAIGIGVGVLVVLGLAHLLNRACVLDRCPLHTAHPAEYTGKLQAIAQQLQLEEAALAQFTRARSTAQLAETRTHLATSLADWHLAHATWQTAIAALQRVAPTTTAGRDAAAILPIYQTFLAQTRHQRTQEEIALKTYDRARELASQARDAEQTHQWSAAVAHWENALTHAHQTPPGTQVHSAAQAMLPAYQSALAAAEERLRVKLLMQRVQPDVDRLCLGTPPLCHFTLTNTAIQLHLTVPLDRAVERLMVRAQPDAALPPIALMQANSLLRQVATLSQAVQTPIELHNATGDRFGEYDPKLSGYVAK